MALIKDGVIYRNLQEQVQKNKDDIEEIQHIHIPDPVNVYEEIIEGAPTCYSITVGDNAYNFPQGGGPGTEYVAGYGIVFTQGHENDTMIEIDTQVVAEKSELQAEVSRAEGIEQGLQDYCDALDGTKASQDDLDAEVTRASEAEASLNTAILRKSTVSVAGSGTSTTQVNYITVDGTEYMLPQPQGGGATWGTITGNIANQQDLMQITTGLSSEITDEVNRAEAAEAALNQSILERATISYVDQADLELSDQISSEADARRSGDLEAVHKTGNETVNGTKTFTSDVTVQVSGNTHTAYYGPSVITHHIPEAGAPKVINLPTEDGTFALTSDIITAVATESERAQQAEATLNTAILARATTEYVDDEIMNEAGQRTMGDNGIINGYLNNCRIQVVSSMPASPSADTIYFVTGA